MHVVIGCLLATSPGSAGEPVLLQAEAYEAEANGVVQIVPWAGALGLACAGWTQGGQWLEWTFEITEAGEYQLGVRCAAVEHETKCQATVDGAPWAELGLLELRPGAAVQGWRVVRWPPPSTEAPAGGEPDTYQRLARGPHVLRLTLLGGGMVLDALALTPAGGDVAQAFELLLESQRARTSQRTYEDLDGDGDPDVLWAGWYGWPALWIDDDDDLRQGDEAGDQDSDCVLVDRDFDGRYDGPNDMAVDWADEDQDNDPDAQTIVLQPGQIAPRSGMVLTFFDPDDNALAAVNWEGMSLEMWGRGKPGRWLGDYRGASFFLRTYAAPEQIADLRYAWDNPFAFYDPDGDGQTEVAVRLVDAPRHVGQEPLRFDGVADTAYVSWDLDNDSGVGNESDYDLGLRFRGGPGLEFVHSRQALPWLRGLAEADRLLADPSWRQRMELVFLPPDEALPAVLGAEWAECWLAFDEDDDEQSWEGVTPVRPDESGAAMRRGDRGEWDTDFSGAGKLYIASCDGRLHLLGAERGVWRAGRGGRDEAVTYEDTDGNGFFDHIQFDYNRDGSPEESVDLLALAGPGADAGLVVDPGRLSYQDLHRVFLRSAEAARRDALELLDAARSAGLRVEDGTKLGAAASVAQGYQEAYWLKQAVYRALRAALADDEARRRAQRMLYTGRCHELAAEVRKMRF